MQTLSFEEVENRIAEGKTFFFLSYLRCPCCMVPRNNYKSIPSPLTVESGVLVRLTPKGIILSVYFTTKHPCRQCCIVEKLCTEYG